jgi:nucleotide-binding universal stress UspA family protein
MSNIESAAAWKVLLAVDGSADCLAAASLLHDLPWPAGSQLTLLAVLPDRAAPDHEPLLASLNTAASVAVSDQLWVGQKLLAGHPAEQLAGYADEHRPDLLVVGAQGLRATLGILLGGVAQQVVEYANCPVLVVRAMAQRPQLRRVLVAIDGSRSAEHVVDYVGRFPLPAQAVINVMHVLPPLAIPNSPPPTWLLGMPPDVPQLYPETEVALASATAEEAEAQTLLIQAGHRITGRSVSHVLARGDAATEILERARGDGADLIVAGSRGLSAVRGWWFGSVSRKLVHYAHGSVLIVKELPA